MQITLWWSPEGKADKGKGRKYVVTEGDSNSGGEHTVQYIKGVL